MPTVSSLFIYPIKSCRGISLQQMHFDERGPVHDRRLMLVDEDGGFLTQRQHPRLAHISTHFDALGQLWVEAPGTEKFAIPDVGGEPRNVSIWTFSGEALDVGDAAASWFRNVLRQRCRLVRFAPHVQRAVSTHYTSQAAQTAFSDGYPVLLTTSESLSELNRRLELPLPMNRFRPNVVLRDCQPFEEDHWAELQGEGLRLSVVKPCERCLITTINQSTLERTKEPLATLAKFRRGAGFEQVQRPGDAPATGVTFGQNCVHSGPGVLRVGDVLVSKDKAQNQPQRDSAS